MSFKNDIHNIIRTSGVNGIDDIIKRCKIEIVKEVKKHKAKMTSIEKVDYTCKSCKTTLIETDVAERVYRIYRKSGKIGALEYLAEYDDCTLDEARLTLKQILEGYGIDLQLDVGLPPMTRDDVPGQQSDEGFNDTYT